MVRHAQTIRRQQQQPMNYLGVVDFFVRLALKGLRKTVFENFFVIFEGGYHEN